MKTKKIMPLILLPMLVFCFLSASLFTVAQVDTSILTMQGKDWQIKIDQALQTETITTSPYVTVAKQGQEKELFLQINTIEECASGSIEFKMDISGLTFYKQLPLDKELTLGEQYDFINATHAMLKDQVVVHRPENVVNSFAGFDSEGRKQLHIYASKIIDAKGQEIWLDSDLTQGLLTIYLPEQKTLESLTFPLLLDPTLGYSTVGGTGDVINGGYVCANRYTASASGIIDTIKFYDAIGFTSPIEVKWAIYDKDLALVGQSNAITTLNAGWTDIALIASVTITNGQNYWFAYNANGTSANGHCQYDSTGTQRFYSLAYASFPASTLAGSDSGSPHQYSMYAEIEDAPTPTPTPTATPTATPPPVSQETDSTLNLVILLACLGLAILLMAWNRIPLLNFVFGIFIIGIAAYSLTINLYAGGLLQLVVIIIGVLCMYSGYREAV